MYAVLQPSLLISSSRSLASILGMAVCLKHQLSWLNNKLWIKLSTTNSSIVILAQGLAACAVLCRLQRTEGCPGASQALGQFEESSSLVVSKILQDRALSNPIWMQWSSCFELLSCCGPWIINGLEDSKRAAATSLLPCLHRGTEVGDNKRGNNRSKKVPKALPTFKIRFQIEVVTATIQDRLQIPPPLPRRFDKL